MIQDDASDWERESSIMGLIYKSALLTICALSSGSAGQSYLSSCCVKSVTVAFRSRLLPDVHDTLRLVA